jgi:hypothetical protein
MEIEMVKKSERARGFEYKGRLPKAQGQHGLDSKASHSR